jgi:hypothetical protein
MYGSTFIGKSISLAGTVDFASHLTVFPPSSFDKTIFVQETHIGVATFLS